LREETWPVLDSAGKHANVDVIEPSTSPFVFGVVNDEFKIGGSPDMRRLRSNYSSMKVLNCIPTWLNRRKVHADYM
jgi:hypothetical protein